MKACVTGGAGFIGSHLVERLVSQRHDVTVLDSLLTGSMDNLRAIEHAITFEQVDLSLGGPRLTELLAGADCVFHLAALPSVVASVQRPLASHACCGTATLALLDAMQRAGVTRVVFSSSCAVYGKQAAVPWHSDMTPHPTSPYAADKLASEHYMEVFSYLYGMTAVSLRYFNVYGPRQPAKSDYAAVIPNFVSAVREHRSPVIYGDGSQTRDFVNVRDVVEANMLAAAHTSSGVFNVASGQPTSVLELYEVLASLSPTAKPPAFEPPRPGEVLHSYGETNRAAQQLGFRTGVSLRDGLAELLA